jgi:hypothetical protein
VTPYVVTFFKNVLDSNGHRFKAPQENIEIHAATPEQAVAAAELRFAHTRHIPNWRYHADTVEISTGSTPVQRCTMRSDTILSLEQRIRDELLLQRRLGSSRRTASAHMPPLQLTGLPLKLKVKRHE